MRVRLLFLLTAMTMAVSSAYAYDFVVDGIYYNILSDSEVEVSVGEDTNTEDMLGSVTPSGNHYAGEVTIPATVDYQGVRYDVTAIGYYAFYYCPDLTAITIPESVISIGEKAFASCYSLTELVLPNSVTTLGDYAFGGCSGITTLVLSDHLTAISAYAFKDLKQVSSLNIPESVTTIGDYAFGGCSALDNVVLPSAVETIGEFAFYNCKSLTTITLSERLTEIPYCAFYYCTNLQNIILPEGIKTIGYQAFGRCQSLTTLTIPSTVEEIKDAAFFYCKSLESLTSLATTPPTCAEYTFDAVPTASCVLYVPYGTSATYAMATAWSDFATIVECAASVTLPCAAPENILSDVAYNLAGQRVMPTAKGLKIVGGKKVLK